MWLFDHAHDLKFYYSFKAWEVCPIFLLTRINGMFQWTKTTECPRYDQINLYVHELLDIVLNFFLIEFNGSSLTWHSKFSSIISWDVLQHYKSH